MKTVITAFALALCTTACAQYLGSVSVIKSSNKSLSFEFKSLKSGSDIIYGAGVSYFYDKGNVGTDYTGFISDMAGAYQQVTAREGAIYFLVGNKISNNFGCVFRFGLGSVKKYTNGRGIPGRPDELWYVRQRVSEDILCGLVFDYKIGPMSFIASWDSFNSFGAGIGINFNYR